MYWQNIWLKKACFLSGSLQKYKSKWKIGKPLKGLQKTIELL